MGQSFPTPVPPFIRQRARAATIFRATEHGAVLI